MNYKVCYFSSKYAAALLLKEFK